MREHICTKKKHSYYTTFLVASTKNIERLQLCYVIRKMPTLDRYFVCGLEPQVPVNVTDNKCYVWLGNEPVCVRKPTLRYRRSSKHAMSDS